MSKGGYMNIDKEQKEVDHVEKGTDLWDEKPPAPHQTWMERAFPGGYIPEFKKTISIAWAMILTQSAQMALQPISTMMGGHLGKAELDAIALANSIINVSGNALVLGMSTACDTYFGQAFGNRQYKYIGILLQTSVAIHTLLFFFCASIHMNMEPILLALGQDPEVSKLAAQCILAFIPGMFCLFMYTVLRKYLASQSIVIPHIIIGFSGLIVAALSQYVFLYIFNTGIVGSALAQGVACFYMLIASLLYIYITKTHELTWGGWSWQFLDGWYMFTKLGLYGIFMVCLEWAAFEVTILLAGILGTTQLAAQGVVFNIDAFFFSLGFGMSDATAIRVAQCLGAGRPVQASTSARVGITLIICVSACSSLIEASLRWYLPKMFTSDPAVIAVVAHIMPFPATYVFFDGIAYVGRGVFRGCGKQMAASGVMAVAFYVIALPIGIPLMFYTSMDLMGCWIGFAIGIICGGIFFLVYLLKLMNWNQAAKEAVERVTRKKTVSICDVADVSVDEHTALMHDDNDSRATALAERSAEFDRFGPPRKLLKKRLVAIGIIVGIFLISAVIRMSTPTFPLPTAPPCYILDVNGTLISTDSTLCLGT